MALGEALIVEPYLSSAVLATLAITKLATAAQRAQWLPQLSAGQLIMVLAHEESDSRHSGSPIQTLAVPSGRAWVLNGRKAVCYHAPLADLLHISRLW